MKQVLLLTSIVIIVGCNTNSSGKQEAVDIIRKCIEVHGGENYRAMDVSFNFRQFRVHLKQRDGIYLYERSTTDSLGNEVHDVLTNEGFKRMVNGQPQNLSEKDHEKYKEGINAIAYFVLLPYKLSEPAVNLKYLKQTEIENQKYHKVSVSFNAEGGGKDYGDEFCYWINQSTYTLDYLSYSSGGPRFRKATKREKVAGIIFQDYENYQVYDTTLHTSKYDEAFKQGKAKLLSKIEQTNYTSHKPTE